MAYFTGPFIAAVGAPGEVHTEQKNPLGAIAIDNSGNWYVYLKGVTSGAQYSWVTYDEAGASTLIDTDVAASLKGPVAILSAALDATTDFGWCGINGSFTGEAGDIADNGLVYATSTAGRVDDAAVQGAQILGAIARSTDDSTANTATFQLSFPKIGFYDPST